MKHSFSYKLTAVFLSLLVLFSSLSYSIEKHFCHDEVYSSFFGDAAEYCETEGESCHTETTSHTCCSSIEKEDSCCANSSEFILGIAIEQQAQTEQSIKLIKLIFDRFSYYNSFIKTVKFKSFNPFFSYKPPNIFIDISIFFQVFRI